MADQGQLNTSLAPSFSSWQQGTLNCKIIAVMSSTNFWRVNLANRFSKIRPLRSGYKLFLHIDMIENKQPSKKRLGIDKILSIPRNQIKRIK